MRGFWKGTGTEVQAGLRYGLTQTEAEACPAPDRYSAINGGFYGISVNP